MKMFLFLLSVLPCMAFAQPSPPQPPPSSIHVIGTADMEIVPDEIYVNVQLKELFRDKKKIKIEELEASFYNYLQKVLKADARDIRSENLEGFVLMMRKSGKEEIITKTYDVKLKSMQQVASLYSVMDSLGVSKSFIRRYSHSKMDAYKKQIKIDAIKASREKAQYLLEAVGAKAGKPLRVHEKSGFVQVDDGTRSGNQYNSRLDNISQSFVEAFDSLEDVRSEKGNKTIKLHYEIEADYEIVN